jgi:hypothetical protein
MTGELPGDICMDREIAQVQRDDFPEAEGAARSAQ